MLELKDIKKTYKVGEIETKALDGISVAFRQKEFVAILGTSGSGKTTCLNIIGGLDRYDSGDLIIKGKSTKDFKARDWDAYRNNTIGFVFQSYNLITHLSIVANVEMGMTLSGVSKAEKHKRALEALEKVGLKDHLHKKPNQLSGGQMQRVAIARALANDPEILLCDEPTGALDTATSVQIMDLIKEVAKDRLVIMVTHNPDLADRYADRIIQFQDGKIVSDTHPHKEGEKKEEFKLKKTAMRFTTALNLSFNNIMTKKGRTFLTAFASSIGIIGIAVILSLSNGFKMQIDSFQTDTLAEFPIMITESAMSVDATTVEAMTAEMEKMNSLEDYTDKQKVYAYDMAAFSIAHTNALDESYISYIDNISPDICSGIGYTRIANMNLVREIDGEYKPISVGSGISGTETAQMGSLTSMSGIGLSTYPISLGDEEGYLEKNYDLLTGSFPTEPTDVVLVVDMKNRLDVVTLRNLGFDVEDMEEIDFSEFIGMKIKLVDNNDFYEETPFGTYMPGSDYEAMYKSENSIPLTVTGIIRIKEEVEMSVLGAGIAYSDELCKTVLDRADKSDIVKAQRDADINIMTGESMTDTAKNQMLSYLGGNSAPVMITIYPKDFETKEQILEYLDAYNEGRESEDKIVYTDLASTITAMTGSIMDGITLVLIAFAAVSLVVSLIMICIITYTSVLERTKEIGILKALGARKKDITRVFDAETFILGVFSGVLGVIIAWACTFPINDIILEQAGLENVAQLNVVHAILLVIVSTILTVLGGHIPARMASKKDAVEALRSE